MDLIGIIRQEIKRQGAISFARFMELALYHPEWGYYEQDPRIIGREGDYYTSVSVGPLFGNLLARQFARWLDELPSPGSSANPEPLDPEDARTGNLHCVEAGAHDGQLALDILTAWQRARPDQFERLQYWILEPSVRRRSWQRQTLREYLAKVRWFDSWHSLPSGGGIDILFANELLDAMPVHRLGWEAHRREWFEWGIVWEAEKFEWTRLPPQTNQSRPVWFEDGDTARHELPASLLSVLPEGFTTEISPIAERWWRDAARWLRAGILLTLDYGLEQEDFFTPPRAQGTVMAYRRHQLSQDLLAQPGLQDLSALVNFTALKAIGEEAGLATLGQTNQGSFLARIFAETGATALGIDSPRRIRQFQTLIHPHHLGRALRVLVQQRSLVNRAGAQ